MSLFVWPQSKVMLLSSSTETSLSFLYFEGVGIRGDVVTVNRDTFHDELFPAGLAVYASPENIEEFEEERKVSCALQLFLHQD